MLVAQVEPGRQAVHLDRAALLGEPREDGLEVDRVRRAVVDQPPGRVAEAADVGRVERGEHALGQLLARRALAAVDARLHPVELGQQVVGQVERTVAADVALGAAQEAERRELLVGGRDLLGLAAHAVGVEAGDGADADRVVADRQVLVAALARGPAHLQDRRPAVRPGRVAVQVAADLRHLDELRDLGRAGLAQLGRDERQAERGEDALLVGRVGQRLVRGDPLRRAGRADELGAEARRLGDDQLDRHALDRHAERATIAALDDGHDLRQRLEPLEHGPVARDDDGEQLGGVAPASRVARRDPAERLGDRLRPAAGCGAGATASALTAAAPAPAPRAACAPSPARSPAPPAAVRPRPPRAAPRACARRARARSRACA